jgi:hypothetical protein
MIILVRIKKPIDYINDLCISGDSNKRLLGRSLQSSYERWTQTLAFSDFYDFMNLIRDRKAEIGSAQFFGKFRAYAFEEYIFRLLQKELPIHEPMKVFWGEKCMVLGGSGGSYAMEFDITIGKRKNNHIEPVMAIEAKVELDSARLKTAIGSFAILKSLKPEVKGLLVYMIKELNENFLKLAENWIDATFQISPENNQTESLLRFIRAEGTLIFNPKPSI